MITVFEPDLTEIKVMPEMQDNEALAGREPPNSGNSEHGPSSDAWDLGSWIPGACPVFCCLLALLALPANVVTARAADDVGWLTGDRLGRQLETSVDSLRWASNPLRGALGSLARSQRTAIFLDRRVDPDQTLDFSVQNEPLREVMQRLAQSLRIGVCRVGPVVYFGPADTATVLGTVVELRRDEIRRWPASVSARLLAAQSVAWPELAQPRELIGRMAQQSRIEIDGLDQVPHDLWPAADLPPLDFAEHLSLLLAGFELTFEAAETTPRIRLVPLPTSATIERSYRMSATQAEQIVDLLGKQFPTAETARRTDGLAVRGSIDAHHAVDRWMRGGSTAPTKRPPAAAGQVRYTLEVKNQPVGAVAKALAERLGLQIEYDPQIRDKLQDPVSFRVEEATRDQLLEALLRPAGLTFEVSGQTLTVVPAASP